MPNRTAKAPYLRIAKRNLAMARLLHLRGYHEGSVFHAYHAFECVISAGIASQNRRIPYSHINKIHDFKTYCGRIIAGTQLQSEFASLSTILVSLASGRRINQVRNQALYWMNKQEPQNRFGKRDPILFTWKVRRFLHEAQGVFL